MRLSPCLRHLRKSSKLVLTIHVVTFKVEGVTLPKYCRRVKKGGRAGEEEAKSIGEGGQEGGGGGHGKRG